MLFGLAVLLSWMGKAVAYRRANWLIRHLLHTEDDICLQAREQDDIRFAREHILTFLMTFFHP